MNKYTKLINNTAVFSISRLGSKIILFLLVPLYTNCLSTAELGIAELVTTASDLLIPILSIGINNAVYRFAFDKEKKEKDILVCFYFVFFFLTISSLFVCLALNKTDIYRGLSLYLFLIIVVSSFNEMYGLFLKAKDETWVFTIDGLVYILSLGVLNLLFLKYYDMKVEGYLLAIIIAKCISIFFMMVAGKSSIFIKMEHINWELLKQMICYSGPLALNSIFWWIMTYLDKYMLELYCGPDAVGLYTVATKVPGMITTLVTIFIEAWTVSYVSSIDSENDGKFYKVVTRIFTTLMVLMIGCILVFIIPFMKIYVNPKFYGAIPSVPILLFSAYAMGFASYFGVVFSVYKKSTIMMYSSLYGAVSNVILNLIFIPRMGMIGAAIATGVAYSIVAVYRYIKTIVFTKIRFNLKKMVLCSFILIIDLLCITNMYHIYVVSTVTLVILIILNTDRLGDVFTYVRNMILRKK